MDIKKVIYIIQNRLEGLSLALPMFVVGLGFIILGVTLFPGIGIVAGIFIWWIAWRFMLSSSRKSRIKEAIKRIKEKQASLLSSSRSKYKAPTAESDVKEESGAKSTATSEKAETTRAGSDR
ncbi:MAG: hypothetical protein ABSF52_05505 [Syntrophobacteraceae bacterium]|jgi:hypothetical protein